MFGKLSLRNIPQDIFNALEAAAIQHDRSTEAEARQAIRAWVEPNIVHGERNQRRKEISERLNRLLEQVNNKRFGQKVRPSHIAQQIGAERAEEIEDWFIGNKEPTFAQLESIATLLGVQSCWLQHGDGRIYSVKEHRLPEDPVAAVDWLIQWDNQDHHLIDELKTLHLIRSLSEAGELYIVKESQRGRFSIFYTPTHVSEIIGAGGETMLKYLFVTLELLYKRFVKGNARFHVQGHLLKPTDIQILTNGNTNPISILLDNTVSMWWEDIWDRSMTDKKEYWPGWRHLYDRMESVISIDKHTSELRTQIRNGVIR